MQKRKGFTLIELLMSIAIIALLSVFVTGWIGSARGRSNDSKTKSQLMSLRTAAENYATTQGSYGTASGCSEGMFAVAEFRMSDLTDESNYPPSTNLTCAASVTSFAVSANLTGEGGYWCVDGRGGKHLSSDPGAITVCP